MPRKAEEEKAEAARKSRRERFEELAPKRVTKVLDALDVLGNCANRSGYEYDQLEIEDIFATIRAAVDATEKAFEPKRMKDRRQYALPGQEF